jgi:hypothetical protein
MANRKDVSILRRRKPLDLAVAVEVVEKWTPLRSCPLFHSIGNLAAPEGYWTVFTEKNVAQSLFALSET